MTVEPRKVGGWYLPGKDSYFDRFVDETGQKANGFQRDHLLEAFRHVKNFGVAVDVGAHVGFWARDMAERFARVYAFEAAPDTYACLAKNMAEHENVTIANFAIGSKSGLCSIEERFGHEGNTGARWVKPTEFGHTPMRSLNSLDLPGCDLLKVDVEGFKSFVLRGAKKLIGKHWPTIIMETDKSFAQGRYHVANTEAEHFLLKRGYACVAHIRPDKVFVHGV